MATETIETQLTDILTDYFDQADFKPNDLFVLGCSTSAIAGHWMGQSSSLEIGEQVITTVKGFLDDRQIRLAVQGCEHINRALLMERSTAERFGYDEVSVVPALHAGGGAQVAAYQQFDDPVEVEHIVAKGGMDIGDVAIAMHVKFVQIPVQTRRHEVGEAHVTLLKSRPKLIGGARAQYTFVAPAENPV